MTNVSPARAAPTRAPDTAPRGPARAPSASDVREMGDAFARARARLAQDGGRARAQPAPQTGAGKEGARASRDPAAGTTGPRGEREALATDRDPFADPLRRERGQEDGGQGGGQSLAGAPPAPVVGVPTMPAPHVDPAAFAQLLADLWTRENGKGAREVSVRFGRDAWPATGARLVRNAAGTLDIALEVGDGGRAYADQLPGLAQRLAGAGVALGALALDRGDQSATGTS
ncbi:hypothetical protein [Sphingomonas sp. BK235]|uniref:hypothetical protein n=1 Tax=Sphingomonas sp. BK235 TaxID=2512131 RepID=UPI00104CAC18|nr:hypothetical protein [Sphingomonas sp. BK235]TCP34366.1 hypothetical protein EV292_104358 [Sphingomonas sp. BK235]